jgi:putative redox protein
MSVIVSSESSDNYRQRIEVDERHELYTDLPVSAGGEGSAPDPHDYFDVALGACKALTVTRYARDKGIPLTGVSVEVDHDGSEERQGRYALSVTLTLKGALTDEQRASLLRVAEKCPLHKLMTTAEVSIETLLSEGAFSQ